MELHGVFLKGRPLNPKPPRVFGQPRMAARCRPAGDLEPGQGRRAEEGIVLATIVITIVVTFATMIRRIVRME